MPNRGWYLYVDVGQGLDWPLDPYGWILCASTPEICEEVAELLKAREDVCGFFHVYSSKELRGQVILADEWIDFWLNNDDPYGGLGRVAHDARRFAELLSKIDSESEANDTGRRAGAHSPPEPAAPTQSPTVPEAGADPPHMPGPPAPRAPEPSPKLPKTRRGLQRLAETTARDLPIVAALKEGKSCRQLAKELGVGKSTVARVAQAYGLTGHAPDPVPVEGTLDENLSARGKPRKHGRK